MSTVLLRFYCVKSPPEATFKASRWHRRFCTLCLEFPNGNILTSKETRRNLMQKLTLDSKLDTKKREETLRRGDEEQTPNLVLSYYSNEGNVKKKKPISRLL